MFFACWSLLARVSRLTRPVIPCAAGSPPLRYFHQGSIGENKLAPFVMEGARASSNVPKHMKRKSPAQRWRPVSTEAVPQKDDITEISNSGSKQVIDDRVTSSENLTSDGITNVVIEINTSDASSSKNNMSFESSSKVVIEDSVEESGSNKDLDGSNVSETYSSTIKVDAPLMRFVKGKGGSTQRQIEEGTGVKIIFPSSREETFVVLEGKSAESIRKASQMIANVLEEAVQSRMLDYSHFISLPLAIHPDLVNKLNYFQSSILGDEDTDKDESRSEGPIDEVDHDHKQADGSSVSIKLRVQEEELVEAKRGSEGSGSSLKDFGIDKSIFIKPKTFHLTVVMLKLWNNERIAKASDVLQSISTQVNEALENRPISIQLRGLTCMKGSPAKARVVYTPVLEVGGEGRLARACKVIIDAFVKSGLVLERDARQELKLHATIMNVRHRKSKKRNQWNDAFDAREIFRKYGKEEWGEYPIPEVHLSQRFKFDESGYYHCCSSIPLPAEAQADPPLLWIVVAVSSVLPPTTYIYSFRVVTMAKFALGHHREAADAGCVRAVAAELILTFLFVFAGVGAAMATGRLAGGADSVVGLTAVALAHTLVVAVMVSAGLHVSGGHINPAVTLGLAATGRITLFRSALYVAAQLLGSSLACLLLAFLTGCGGAAVPVHALAPGVGSLRGVLMEAVLTFSLLFAVYAAVVDQRGGAGAVGPLLVGLVVGANVLAGGPFSGASMNPARSFGPALAAGVWADQWVYWVGPLIGGPLAGLVYDGLFMDHGGHVALPNPRDDTTAF
ncbi:hypothetical protein BS78_03G005800 [Paspalum vaginatum]|nr:hypothetical protein BS78_03G005800 [Paspalum vaginatum]